MANPFYYRFVLHPSDGSVELAHNWEDLAHHVRYHSELGGEGDSYNGYAYRIGGGWRLTDWDHKTVDDPYVVAQVIRAIREQEGAHLPHDPVGPISDKQAYFDEDEFARMWNED